MTSVQYFSHQSNVSSVLQAELTNLLLNTKGAKLAQKLIEYCKSRMSAKSWGFEQKSCPSIFSFLKEESKVWRVFESTIQHSPILASTSPSTVIGGMMYWIDGLFMGYRRQETERPQSYPSHPNCIVQFLHLKTDCEAIDIDCQICLDPNNQWTSACEVEEICFDFDSCSGDSQNVSEDPLCSIDPNERNNRTIGEVSQALVLFEEDPKGTAFHEPLIVVQTSPVSNSSLPNQQKR